MSKLSVSKVSSYAILAPIPDPVGTEYPLPIVNPDTSLGTDGWTLFENYNNFYVTDGRFRIDHTNGSTTRSGAVYQDISLPLECLPGIRDGRGFLDLSYWYQTVQNSFSAGYVMAGVQFISPLNFPVDFDAVAPDRVEGIRTKRLLTRVPQNARKIRLWFIAYKDSPRNSNQSYWTDIEAKIIIADSWGNNARLYRKDMFAKHEIFDLSNVLAWNVITGSQPARHLAKIPHTSTAESIFWGNRYHWYGGSNALLDAYKDYPIPDEVLAELVNGPIIVNLRALITRYAAENDLIGVSAALVDVGGNILDSVAGDDRLPARTGEVERIQLALHPDAKAVRLQVKWSRVEGSASEGSLTLAAGWYESANEIGGDQSFNNFPNRAHRISIIGN